MDTKEPRTNSVKSLRKAFSILEELDRCGELSLAEVSDHLTMDKGTAYRLLGTMKEAGYVIQNRETKRYSNSLKLFAMGNRVAKATGYGEVVRPYVDALSERSGETANFGLRTGNSIVYLVKCESKETIRAGLDIGTTVPLYCTGMGKSVLAYLPEDELAKVLSSMRFRKYTETTVSSKEELRSQIAVIRENGYCRDDKEFVDGLICFAAPVFDFHGYPIGAVSLSIPEYRYDPGTTDEKLSALVIDTANAISRQIGRNS
jgi:IclR family KDG regulon transcriptional repressor